MKKKRLLTVVGSICLALVLAAVPFMAACAEEPAPTPAPAPAPKPTPAPAPKPAPKPAPVTLKMAMYQATTHLYYQDYMEYLVPKVEELTEGRVTIKIFPSSTLLGGRDMYPGIQEGKADLAMPYAPYMAATLPLFDVTTLIIWRDDKGLTDTFKYGGWDLYQEELIANGFENIQLIAPMCSGMRQLGFRKKEVRVPSDLKGIKIKGSGKGDEEFLERQGGASVYIPTAEVYEALEKGVIGGTVGGPSNWSLWKRAEPCKYLLANMPFGNQLMALIASKKSLDKLDPMDRNILVNQMQMATYVLNWHSDQMNVYWMDWVVPKMTTYLTLTPEEIDKWLAEGAIVAESWKARAGARGQKMLDLVAKYNAIE